MNQETLPEHLRRPHLRAIQPIPVEKDGKQLVALRDPSALTKQTIVIQPGALPALQLLQGEQDIEEIAQALKAPLEQITALVRGLDEVGLLWGPNFERLERELKERIASNGAFFIGASGSMGPDPDACRGAMDEWLGQTEDPELDAEIVGVVAPHLDYERGWPNYAAAYRCVETAAAPDRVVLLGTNHYGIGDGVVLTEYGFDTPIGRMSSDSDVTAAMVERLGDALVVDQLDHHSEHSIQLHLPWVQRRFGNIPIVAVLVPDPLAAMISDDGERIAMEPFVTAMREVLDDVGGRTFFIASSDLSHVGPQFGEPRPVDDQRRLDVESHDREMMSKYVSADSEEFISAMRWCNNPTRWCSIGNMTAALLLARPSAVELIDYRQAVDDRGLALVSSAAMALVR